MEILRSRANKFVMAAWLLFLVSIPVCFLVGWAAGHNLFYASAHPTVTLNEYDLQASRFVLASASVAAVLSSLALAFKLRAIASISVILIWTVALAGTPVARLFVKPGADFFERHVGSEAFLVPWQYVEAGYGVRPSEHSNENGFATSVCLASLKGRDDVHCHAIRKVRIFPEEMANADYVLKSWHEYRPQMISGPDRGGYRSFDVSYTPYDGGLTRVSYFYVRFNSSGEPVRLVLCMPRGVEICTHRALVGNYWFGYEADLADGDETLDAKLAALVESWRRK